MSEKSNISAVVLTIGESTLQRALDSIKSQSVPIEDIIIIKDVVPFHKALNLGASKVKTKYFLQVDSDMILDEYCAEDLSKCIQENTGIVVGHLRDPLIGRISSIKLFNRECFDEVTFSDSISPDTDYINRIERLGWYVSYALKYECGKDLWHTFGEHKPNYDFTYTFSKYIIEGRRYIHRSSYSGLRWHFNVLSKSTHPMSVVARIALLHGVFIQQDEDKLKPYNTTKESEHLERLMNTHNDYPVSYNEILNLKNYRTRTIFKKFFIFGLILNNNTAFPSFYQILELFCSEASKRNFTAVLGLCHGFFHSQYNELMVEKDYKLVKEILERS